MTEMLQRAAKAGRLRRTDRPASDFERPLRCTHCDELVLVFEAAQGAKTEDEHRFLDPATFVCEACL